MILSNEQIEERYIDENTRKIYEQQDQILQSNLESEYQTLMKKISNKLKIRFAPNSTFAQTEKAKSLCLYAVDLMNRGVSEKNCQQSLVSLKRAKDIFSKDKQIESACKPFFEMGLNTFKIKNIQVANRFAVEGKCNFDKKLFSKAKECYTQSLFHYNQVAYKKRVEETEAKINICQNMIDLTTSETYMQKAEECRAKKDFKNAIESIKLAKEYYQKSGKTTDLQKFDKNLAIYIKENTEYVKKCAKDGAALYEDGKNEYLNGNFKEAKQLFENAKNNFNVAENWTKSQECEVLIENCNKLILAESDLQKAENLIELKKFLEAENLIDNCKKTFQLFNFNSQAIQCDNLKKQMDERIELLKQEADKVFNNGMQSLNSNNLAIAEASFKNAKNKYAEINCNKETEKCDFWIEACGKVKKADELYLIGRALTNKSDYIEALNYCNQAKNIYSEFKLQTKIAEVETTISFCNSANLLRVEEGKSHFKNAINAFNVDNFDLAIDEAEKAKKCFAKLDDEQEKKSDKLLSDIRELKFLKELYGRAINLYNNKKYYDAKERLVDVQYRLIPFSRENWKNKCADLISKCEYHCAYEEACYYYKCGIKDYNNEWYKGAISYFKTARDRFEAIKAYQDARDCEAEIKSCERAIEDKKARESASYSIFDDDYSIGYDSDTDRESEKEREAKEAFEEGVKQFGYDNYEEAKKQFIIAKESGADDRDCDEMIDMCDERLDDD